MMLCSNFFQRCFIQKYIASGLEITSIVVAKYSTSNCKLWPAEIRNIGIMAHIDAGKTTTTERMLFYAGHINTMGDVDSGNTVTDFLPTEIERGITIQSAAVSFGWQNCNINLIDTPGHVDFTVEVERSLRVLDSAVAIFDAAKGVEAQSRTVWKQADRHHVPRLAFVNKMDKPAADFYASVKSIEEQLAANCVVLQIPLHVKGEFLGVIDVVRMEEVRWDAAYKDRREGRTFSRSSVIPGHSHWDALLQARAKLIEKLADISDDLAETWLVEFDGDPALLPSSDLISSIRLATRQRSCVPVLCGSSFRNIGVQPLLDAVVDYLPSPTEIQHDFTRFYTGADDMTAMAFKVAHDSRHGKLVFVRVYSGTLRAGARIFNANKSLSETVARVMRADADVLAPIDDVTSGQIAIVSGLKSTATGDTLVTSEPSFERASREAAAASNVDRDEESASGAVLSTIPIPQPVFFCSVIPHSASQEKALRAALQRICEEDPSVRWYDDDDGGAFRLAGMGELHMEIVADRLTSAFKVRCDVGQVQVAYREQPTQFVRHTETFERKIVDRTHHVKVAVSVTPTDDDVAVSDVGDVERAAALRHPAAVAALRGVVQACRRGDMMGYPIVGARLRVHAVESSHGAPPALITSCAVTCTRHALKSAACHLLEPVMRVEVTAPDSLVGSVLGELSRRHATIGDVTPMGGRTLVNATAPVAEMRGYSSSLRSATSGRGDLALQVVGYQVVPIDRVNRMRSRMAGAG